LQVIRRLVRNTEVLHISWHLYFALLANPEEVVYGIAACKDHSRVRQNVYLVFSELFKRNRLYLNKRPEVNFYIVLFSDRQIRRVVGSGLWLRHQNCLYRNFVPFRVCTALCVAFSHSNLIRFLNTLLLPC